MGQRGLYFYTTPISSPLVCCESYKTTEEEVLLPDKRRSQRTADNEGNESEEKQPFLEQ